jgi:hypothetical protein
LFRSRINVNELQADCQFPQIQTLHVTWSPDNDPLRIHLNHAFRNSMQNVKQVTVRADGWMMWIITLALCNAHDDLASKFDSFRFVDYEDNILTFQADEYTPAQRQLLNHPGVQLINSDPMDRGHMIDLSFS